MVLPNYNEPNSFFHHLLYPPPLAPMRLIPAIADFPRPIANLEFQALLGYPVPRHLRSGATRVIPNAPSVIDFTSHNGIPVCPTKGSSMIPTHQVDLPILVPIIYQHKNIQVINNNNNLLVIPFHLNQDNFSHDISFLPSFLPSIVRTPMVPNNVPIMHGNSEFPTLQKVAKNTAKKKKRSAQPL